MRYVYSLVLMVTASGTAVAAVDLPAGRGAGEIPTAIATSPSGAVYVAGQRAGRGRGEHIYVAKIEAGGARREYTAQLGGSGEDVVKAIAIDRLGNAYIVGHTTSADFSVVGGAERRHSGGADVFLAKVDGKGQWLYSTVFGGAGNDVAQGLAIDANGDVHITGWTASNDFPADGEKRGAVSGFAVKFRGVTRVSGNLFGDGGRTVGNGIAVDGEGAIYIAGSMETNGHSEALLLKLNHRGERVYRNVLSGSKDQSATSVALADNGVAWIGGWTSSSDFAGGANSEFGGGRDAFVARFDAEGLRTFSKTIGGKSDDEGHEVAVDAYGNVYLAGITRSDDFPTLEGATANTTEQARSFAVKLSAAGDRTYFSQAVASARGGSEVRMAVDRAGHALLTGSDKDGGSVQSVATCRYRLSKALHNFDASGGDASVAVEAPAECGWNAENYTPWIGVARVGDRFEFRAAPNDGAPRAATVVAGDQTLIIYQAGKPGLRREAITGAIRSNAGFQTTSVGRCDDCSAAVTPLGFSINFFGTTYTQVYVNNNGNVTFNSSNSTYTASSISSIQRVIIAPFWADVDTGGTASGITSYGTDLINGRKAFGVNWVDVGYFSSKTDKLNSMQLVLIDRSDLGVGFFDIEMNYASIQWEAGSASGGTNGLGGSTARAGFSNGTGTVGTYFELPGSAVVGAFLNGGPNSLASNSSNSGGVAGRYIYGVRAGSIVCGTGLGTTSAALPIAGGPVSVTVTASNAACTWNVTGLPSWITVTSPAGGNGTGNGTVALQVAGNSGAGRNAVLTIAGQSFTVSQNGSAAPTNCPPVSFQRGADVSMLTGNLSQGVLAGLERLANGSLTLHSFTGNSTNYTQSSTPQYQQAFTNCIGLPATTPTPPANYRLLSETRGTSAVNPIVTDLMGTGASSSVGVGAYSQDAAKLQVWNSTPAKTPGTKATYDCPANPQKLLSADLNNDNKRDVVLLSQGTTGGTQGVLSTFVGNGDGTLGQRRDSNVGSNPQSATLFDFNQDNRLDAAVANTGSNNVMILNGNGDGSLQAPVTLTGEAAGPRAIAAADLNKDNRGDLIIGHSDGVDIRLGNGNGTFQAPVRVARGFVATSVASGDFNKDGNPDIAVSAETSASVMVLLGNGNGTFGPPNGYVTRANAGSFWASDFDWDGNPDIVFGAGHPDGVVAAANDSNITVLYGRGNGTFHGVPSVVLTSLGDFTSGDFNSDGAPDVVATAPLANSQTNAPGLNVALNNGSGSLVLQTPISVPSVGAPAQLFKITSADFNGDGLRDVAVTSGNQVHMLRGNGAGGFSAPVSFTAGSQMTALAAADINGDGRADLIITDDGEDRVSVALSNSNGTFQARTPLIVGVDPKGVAVADVNGDGRLDLVVVNFGTAGNDSIPGGISVLLGAGGGTFQAATNFASGLHPTNVTVGDVNLDGRPDLVTTTGGPNNAYFAAVHLGNGNGTFQTPTLLPVALGPAQTALTDFNADGRVDILVGHCCGDIQMGVLLGNGNGTFQTETTIPNTGNGSSFVVVADMNRDAKPDILFGAQGSPGAYVATLLNVNSAVAPICTFGVSQSSYSIGTQAQTLTGTLSASSGTCSFNASASASWLSVTPTSGQGQTSTTYNITVQANSGVQRVATVTIGGQAITVTQGAPACPYTLAPLTLSPPPAGGGYNISVSSSPGCPWSITGVPAWVTILDPAGLNSAGTGTISLTVAANAGVARIANLVIAGRNFPITQAGIGPAGGLRFTALEPCRLLETRAEYNFENRTGAFGPPFFSAGDTRTLPLPSSSVCRNIPANAKAYVLNVTVVPNGTLDAVTVYPTGETRPDFWTVRSLDGLIVANSAIVAAGMGGAINVYASHRTDLIIDISGYFTDNPVTSNLVYYPLTPCRVIETRIDYRPTPGPFGPPTMGSRETRTFRFPENGVCPVPQGAAAYAATITVVPPGPLAFLTAWPEAQTMPNVSSMNSPAGRVLANSVIVPASPDGGIQLFTFDRSDVIVDITGYFGPDDGSSGLFFFPVRQCRVSQTNGVGFTGVFNGPIFENETSRTIPIPASACTGIPGNARAYSLNATVMAGGSPMPFLTVYPSGQARPNASVINAFEGQTVSSGFLVTAGTNGAVDIFAYRRTHVALEISGYFGR